MGAWLTVVEFLGLLLMVPFYWPRHGSHTASACATLRGILPRNVDTLLPWNTSRPGQMSGGRNNKSTRRRKNTDSWQSGVESSRARFSAASERADLLAKAQVWEVLAARVERVPR
jgi:hypothetical protein